jgi:hypothetical protein
MKKNKYLIILFATALSLCLSANCAFAGESENAKTDATAVSGFEENGAVVVAAPAGTKVVKASDTSLKLSWKKVLGASGYAVYKWNTKAKKYRVAKTLTGAGKIVLADKKLKSNTSYKYKVRAFKNVGGKKQYGGFGDTVVARAFTGNVKTVNATGITVDYAARYLGLRGVKKVVASVTVPKGKTALSKTLTWRSSNRSIVKVNKYGWIEAQGKPGKARVYIRAHNGVTKTLSITVADYAHPAKFSNLDKVTKWNKRTSDILSKYRNEITTIAAWLERFKNKVKFFYQDGDLHYNFDTMNFEPVETELESLLKETSMSILLENGNLYFFIPPKAIGSFGATILYCDWIEKVDNSEGVIKIAPGWYFFDDRNDLD